MPAWSQDEDLTIRRHARTHSASQIAAMMTGRSRAAVIGRAWRLGESLAKDAATKLELEHPGHRRAAAVLRPSPARAAEPWPAIASEARRAAMKVEPLMARLEQLETSQCRWPYGEDTVRFCGRASAAEGPYCAAHRGLAYVPDGSSYDADALALEIERKENKARTMFVCRR